MTKRVRVNGIYDLRTIKELIKLQVKHIGFDFRPKSFNFIQIYKVEEFIKDIDGHFEKIYLHFSDEKDFMIQKIIQDILKTGITKEQIVLEFSDSLNQEFYEQFGINYIVHLDKDLRNLERTKLLKGISLHSAHLEEIIKSDQFPSFVNEVYTFYPYLKSDQTIELHLDMNWDSEPYTCYSEYLKPEFIIYSINPLIEVCYRNVNLPKLDSYLKKLPIDI